MNGAATESEPCVTGVHCTPAHGVHRVRSNAITFQNHTAPSMTNAARQQCTLWSASVNQNSLNNFSWDNLELAAKRKEAIKRTWKRTPEQLEKMSEGVKAAWARRKAAAPPKPSKPAKLVFPVKKIEGGAFLRKLRSEGFTSTEIANLLKTGNTEGRV